MASTKYIITADVSQAQSNIDKLKVQYTSTLQDIAKNQELLKQKEQELEAAKQKRIGLASRSKELKEANAVVTKLNQEKVALEQVDKTLKRTLELNKAKVAVENDIIQGIQRELSATDRLKEAQRQQNIETAKAIRAEEELSRKRQLQALKANILAREEAKRQLQAQKDRLLINSRPEQIDRKYQNYLREVAELRKKGTISIYEERKAIRNLNQAKREELINNRSLANQIVRHIRQVESLAVAMYGLYRVWHSTMGVGIEFNKTVEDEGVGLKLLLVNSLANVDAQGKLLTLKDKYNIANSKYLGILQKIREINPETPYNLQDTIKVYKALFPQLIRHKATLSQIGEITKKLTIVAKANNLEVGQFLKTIDTAFTGEMKESQLSQALNRMGLTNKAIKEAIKNGTLLNLVFDKLKDVNSGLLGINDTWSNALSRFQTQWQELWGNLSMPTFIGFKQSVNSVTDYLKNNRAEVESYINTTASLAKQLVALYAIYRISKVKSLALGNAITWTSTKFKLARASLSAFSIITAETNAKMGMLTVGMARVRIASSMLRLSIVALGRGLMSLAIANPVLVGLTVAFEAYNYVVGKSAEKQAELNRLLHITTEEYKKMGKAEALHNLDVVREKLITQRQITSELRRERASIKANYGLHSAEYHAINAKYEAQVKVVRELDNTRISLNDVINGTYIATDAVYKTANGANALANELNSAKFEAYGVASALDTSILALEKTLIRARAMRGEINKIQSISLTASLDKKAIDSQLKDALGAYDKLGNKDSEAREKALQKLNVKVVKLVNKQKLIELDTEQKLKRAKEESARAELRANKAKLQHSIIIAKNNKHYKQAIALEKKSIELEKSVIKNKLKSATGVEKINLQTQLQELENRQLAKTYSLHKKIGSAKKRAYNAEKRHTKAITNTNTALNEQKSLQKQIADIKANWYTFGKDEVAEAKTKLELAKKQMATTKAMKHFDRAKYEKSVNNQLKARLAYLQAEHKQLEAIYNIYKGGIDSIFKGDIKGGLTSMLDGFGEMLMKPMKESVASYLTELTNSLGGSSLGALGGGLVGAGLSLIPTLLGSLGHKLTEAEINKAKGRTDFTDESLTKLGSIFDSAVNKDLPYNKKMVDYLASIKDSMFKLGGDIAGSDFAIQYNKHSSSGSSFLGGLWGDSSETIGGGIKLNDIDFKNATVKALQYSISKETSSFLWMTDESIKETTQAVGSATQYAINQTLASGKSMIIESAKVLGYNVEDALNKVKLSLGKISLDGKSSEEIAKIMQNAMGEVFSKAIDQLGDINYLVDRYAKAGEKHLETLGRIAMNYEQASDLLKRINFKFSGVDFDPKTVLVPYKKQRTEVRQVSKFIIGSYADAMDAGKNFYAGGYYTTVTEKINKTVTGYKKVLYTAQMAVLDIVEASGGMDKFNTNYNSFVQNYYSKAEQKKMLEGQLKDSFNGLNVTMPKTKEQLRQMIETYKVMGKDGAKTYAELLRLSDSFSTLADMEKQLRNIELEKNKALLNSAREYKNKITDLYLGQYSPLKMAQKELLAMRAVNNTTGTDWEASSKRALEISYNNATSTQDYRSAFNSYLQALNTNAPKATMDDLAEKLDKQNAILAEQKKTQDEELKTAIKQIDELQKVVDTLSKANQQQRVG